MRDGSRAIGLAVKSLQVLEMRPNCRIVRVFFLEPNWGGLHVPSVRKAITFTTGSFAELCGVTHRIVLYWIKTGKLNSYCLPGRGDNRITGREAVHFMTRHQIPIPWERMEGCERPVILVLAAESGLADALRKDNALKGYSIQHVSSHFEAGLEIARSVPEVIVCAGPDGPNEEVDSIASGLKRLNNERTRLLRLPANCTSQNAVELLQDVLG
jgi:hypothetical protein